MQACSETSRRCGISYESMVRFVKEKIYARSLKNNKPVRETKASFEKLSKSQVDLIRLVVCTFGI